MPVKVPRFCCYHVRTNVYIHVVENQGLGIQNSADAEDQKSGAVQAGALKAGIVFSGGSRPRPRSFFQPPETQSQTCFELRGKYGTKQMVAMSGVRQARVF